MPTTRLKKYGQFCLDCINVLIVSAKHTVLYEKIQQRRQHLLHYKSLNNGTQSQSTSNRAKDQHHSTNISYGDNVNGDCCE